ncbi:amino acid carrier protein [Desulfosporosinus orientis DSM 765]|uniref:Amino acid carrier protein n=1 Tax=Desulfosporosinus orientis (strain ATCC 19365 / DSM 765 / NCIMB 8382 / VKM B-1628 / Singapore I) TaxID=768706 RepID=G7WDP7_DESOD|nr:sodium:alanine symporter family protein [Desulfosporosinus orientis]AET68372.1 amino acid carrier protein [Desulfosporosinus orientis DSM 765]
MNELINKIDSFVWGPFTIVLLVGTGILITLLVRAIQVRKFVYAWQLLSGKYDDPNDEGEITHFQALSAALSATIGTGNIAGVGTAIAIGGPGALFWMWVTAFVGMATKYAEALLSLRFRAVHEDGSVSGGPMYYLEKGLGQKWLAMLFALFAAIASFGIGNMVQANSVAEPALKYFHIPKIATGIILAVLVFAVIVGGIKRIGRVASRVVPFMTIFYVLGSLIVIILNFSSVPHAFSVIFHDAFTGTAATGGFAGSVVAQAIRYGVARGVFSNEAGLGSAPIAHGAAKTKYPVREGLVAMLGPFIDTIVICTMTGLVIVTTGAFAKVDEAGKALTGANLTAKAFNLGLPGPGEYIVAIGIIFFALSTIISWSYYGDRAVEYLLGSKFILPYRILYCLLIPVGAATTLEIIWNISDVFNALMALPNLIGLILLSGTVIAMTKEYFGNPENIKAKV